MCLMEVRVQWRSNCYRYSTIDLHVMTWHNLDAPIIIRRRRLNDDNSHPRNSSEPLIEDELPNLTATPIFCLFILSLWRKMYSLMFRLIELFRHISPWISCYLHILNSFLPPKSSWKWDFTQELGDLPPKHWNSFSKSQNKKPLIRRLIGSFWARFSVRLCVCHVSLDFIFET